MNMSLCRMATSKEVLAAAPHLSPMLTDKDHGILFEERAAVLEYDEGLTRGEAERLARQQVGPSAVSQPINGIIVAVAPEPAVALSAVDYDAALGRLIAEAGDDDVQVRRLRRDKLKGLVVTDGERKIYTMGRL